MANTSGFSGASKYRSKIVVACTNASGEPDLFFFIMEGIPADALNDGEHYDHAKRYAESQGYEGDMVVFDSGDMSDAFAGIFAWGSASVAQYGDC